uniref:Uncharacterized protein n=1 Tax=Panagrolaimus sp. ES5 TaxID=591445 RepID=A0AC34F528_9BILA
MDLFDEQKSASLSTLKNGKRKADDSKNVFVPSKRDLFLSTYLRYQEWSLPESIIYYMAKNPKNAAVYEKLIQSCKYFFVQNPIIVADRFSYIWDDESDEEDNEDNVEGATAYLYRDQECIELPTVLSKFWITDKFGDSLVSLNHNMVSSILPKFYRVDVKELCITRQNISFNDFIFLAFNVEDIRFGHTVVKNEDGSIVPLEKLLALLPNVKNVKIFNNRLSSCITTNTVKELLKLPHFSNIINFQLSNIGESFDIETFFTYMKKTRSTKFNIYFCPLISETFKNHLEEMIDEILETKTRGIQLRFYGIAMEKYVKMESLYNRPL